MTQMSSTCIILITMSRNYVLAMDILCGHYSRGIKFLQNTRRLTNTIPCNSALISNASCRVVLCIKQCCVIQFGLKPS